MGIYSSCPHGSIFNVHDLHFQEKYYTPQWELVERWYLLWWTDGWHCVYIIVWRQTSMGGWRCGQWEFFFFLRVWLHKQMGADILISTGNTLGLFSSGIWHQQATGKTWLHLWRDGLCTAGQRDINEAWRLPAQIWKYNRPNLWIIPAHMLDLQFCMWMWICSALWICLWYDDPVMLESKEKFQWLFSHFLHSSNSRQ